MGRYRYKKVHGKKVQEHILVWERANGRKLPEGYDIHHIDGNGRNNDLSNLMLIEHGEHAKLHHEMRRKGIDPVNPDDPDVIATRNYLKRHYQRHRDEILAKHREYRETHREETRAQNKAYRESHKEERQAYVESHKDELDAYHRAYREKNRELIREKSKQRHAINPERDNAYLRAYRAENREILSAKQQLRYLTDKGAPQSEIDTCRDRLDAALSNKVLEVAPCIDYALETVS